MIPFLASCILAVALLAFPLRGEAAYIFETIDIPGATNASVMGLGDDDAMVGGAVDTLNRPVGWHRTADGCLVPMHLFAPKGLGPAGIVGSFDLPSLPPGTSKKGFLIQGMERRIIEAKAPGLGRPKPTLTEVVGTAGNWAVGYYRSAASEGGAFHQFLYAIDTQAMTTVVVPDATSSEIMAVSATGKVIGKATVLDQPRVFVREAGGILTFLDVPGIGKSFEPVGLTDGNVFALNTETEAYVWDGAALEQIAVPGALFTRLRGMRADRTLYGFFVAADGTGHGFVARPAATVAPQPRQPVKSQETKPGPKLPQRR